MILAIANMGTERIAPGIPHIQNQKTSEMMTRTGLRVNREQWQRSVSSTVHTLLYALLLAMPIVGYIANSAFGASTPFFGLFDLPPIVGKNEALSKQLFVLHRWAGYAVAALALLHIGAALQHYFIRRDGVLQRMLPGGMGDQPRGSNS